MGLRIISGIYGGRKLHTPEDMGDNSAVRPTKGKVRAAMLNMLNARVNLDECTVADLFCGSGSLGIEALSRGATHCTFIDLDSTWVKKNIEHIKAPEETYKIIRSDVLNISQPLEADVIFIDPPYGLGLTKQAIDKKELYGKKDSIWIIELERITDLEYNENDFELLKEKSYGLNKVILLRQKS